MKNIICNTRSEKILKINNIALEKINHHLQIKEIDNEAGGVIVGRELISSGNFVIDDISTPLKRDIRKRHFFNKYLPDHQKFIQQKWTESQGTCSYLGEWHTHPEDTPTPSSLDICSWKNVLKRTVCDEVSLFFIIAGNKEIRIWEGFVHDLTIEQIY
ncbi:Mov34/MPN/PAD-1 family protein [Bacillus cereus]